MKCRTSPDTEHMVDEKKNDVVQKAFKRVAPWLKLKADDIQAELFSYFS